MYLTLSLVAPLTTKELKDSGVMYIEVLLQITLKYFIHLKLKED